MILDSYFITTGFKLFLMRSLLIFFVLSISICLYGQNTVTGEVWDSNNEPLVGATVVLLDLDSTMVAFSLVNEEGEFTLEDIEEAQYIIQASFISYANFSEILALDWTEKEIQIERIVLKESTEVLQEVTIKAEHIPMGLHGDTLSYNAAAFKTRPNATVEDLLKKLPGIDVNRDGSIRAQGEDVENVLVDGKEFFGSDPKMATKNLEAEAVDKVEVYDKKSEIAEFTGVDDGQEEKTINLKLKEDHKKGGFGNANIAMGTEESYDSKLNYFRFTPTLQASLIFSANNINKETFTINDRIDFMGGMMNAMSGGMLNLSSYGGVQDGLNSSLSGGTNFNYDFSPKLTLRSHYLLNRTSNYLEKYSNIQSFTDVFDYSNTEDLNSNKGRLNHQVNTKFTYKLNPYLELVFKNNINLTDQFSDRDLFSNYTIGGQDQGYASSLFNSQSEAWNLESNTLIKKKYEKKGRNIISSITFKKSDDLSSDEISNVNRISENSFDVNQVQDYKNKENQLSITTDYTEPLSKKYYLSLSYAYGRSNERPYREYYDIIDANEVFNDQLSADYQKIYTYNIGGLSIKRNTKKLKLSLGLKGQITQLDGIINSGLEQINGTYKNLLPAFSLDYDLARGQSINSNFNTSVDAPDLEQLLPLPNNTFANYAYIGNPNLVPAYVQRLRMGYNYYDNFSFTNLWISGNISRTQNRIVTKTNIDENLFRTLQPINVDEYLSAMAHISFSKPFKPLKLNYRIRTRVQYANYESFINENASKVIDNNLNLKISLDNRSKKYFSTETGLTLDFFTKKYGINPDFNQNYFNTDLYVESEFYLPKAWIIGSDINHVSYSNESFSSETSYTLWSITVSKFFLEERLEIRGSVFDLLNENIGFRRLGNENSLRQESYNNLGRYFSVGLHYKIGNGKKKGGIQVDID